MAFRALYLAWLNNRVGLGMLGLYRVGVTALKILCEEDLDELWLRFLRG